MPQGRLLTLPLGRRKPCGRGSWHPERRKGRGSSEASSWVPGRSSAPRLGDPSGPHQG